MKYSINHIIHIKKVHVWFFPYRTATYMQMQHLLLMCCESLSFNNGWTHLFQPSKFKLNDGIYLCHFWSSLVYSLFDQLMSYGLVYASPIMHNIVVQNNLLLHIYENTMQILNYYILLWIIMLHMQKWRDLTTSSNLRYSSCTL